MEPEMSGRLGEYAGATPRAESFIIIHFKRNPSFSGSQEDLLLLLTDTARTVGIHLASCGSYALEREALFSIVCAKMHDCNSRTITVQQLGKHADIEIKEIVFVPTMGEVR
eukprot:1659959-Pleurochrysis_carterae.AAC.2